MSLERLRIILLGYIVRGPLGGLVWHHLQYAMGLARLGHDVYFLEDSDDYPSCYIPGQEELSTDPAVGLEFAARIFESVGLGNRWAYYDGHTGKWFGACREHAVNLCADADIVLNLSGVSPLRPWLDGIAFRVFVDTDPVFTQIRHLTDASARAAAAQHTAFFTFGENFGRSAIPDDGFPWQPTRQPIVLEAWPVSSGRRDGRFTTVMQWSSYRPREYGGQTYDMKSKSFEAYLGIPRAAGGEFELAAGAPAEICEMLRNHGWIVTNPLTIADASTYQEYIRNSMAEFTVAKHGYVVSRCGWFSERTAAYLASGRPAVVQDTGFSEWMACGSGVLPFRCPEEALDCIAEVRGNYDRHCRSAREIASGYFDSRQVLTSLIERSIQ